jgi:hypothetical protein
MTHAKQAAARQILGVALFVCASLTAAPGLALGPKPKPDIIAIRQVIFRAFFRTTIGVAVAVPHVWDLTLCSDSAQEQIVERMRRIQKLQESSRTTYKQLAALLLTGLGCTPIDVIAHSKNESSITVRVVAGDNIRLEDVQTAIQAFPNSSTPTASIRVSKEDSRFSAMFFQNYPRPEPAEFLPLQHWATLGIRNVEIGLPIPMAELPKHYQVMVRYTR